MSDNSSRSSSSASSMPSGGKAAPIDVVADSPAAGSAPEKNLGFTDGVAFMIVAMVGSGVFFAPGEAAKVVGSPCGTILAFVFAGVLCLFGGLCYSELGTTFVSAGAEADYLKRAFGVSTSFSFTWTTFLVICGGACAGISTVASSYLLQAFGIDPSESTILATFVAIALLWSIALTNCFLSEYTAIINKVMMGIKISSALFVVIGAISGPENRDETFLMNDGEGCFANTDPAGFITAVVFGLFAMSGWNMLNPLTEELRNPSRDVPRIYIAGMFMVTLIVVLFNISFFSSLPKSQMTSSLAAPFALAVANQAFAVLISVMACLCCLGSDMGMMMGVSRIVCSAANNGDFPAIFGRLSGKKQVPIFAIVSFSAWTSLLLLAMDLEPLVAFFTIGQWFFFVLVTIGLIRLRTLYPDVERPYKVNLVLPVVFVIVSIAILFQQTFYKGNSFKAEYSSLGGFVIVAVGYVVFYAKESFKSRSTSSKEAEAGAIELETPTAQPKSAQY